MNPTAMLWDISRNCEGQAESALETVSHVPAIHSLPHRPGRRVLYDCHTKHFRHTHVRRPAERERFRKDGGQMKAARKETIASTFDNLRRVVQVVQGYSKRAERVAGLTGPQLWAIKVLAESAPVMVSDLARRMYLHPSTVIGILDRLETRGLVGRTRSTEDRRVVTVVLTRKGKETVKKVPVVAQGLLLTGLEELSDPELKVIAEGLELLVGILGAGRMPPQLLFSEEVNAPHGADGVEAVPGNPRTMTIRRARKRPPR